MAAIVAPLISGAAKAVSAAGARVMTKEGLKTAAKFVGTEVATSAAKKAVVKGSSKSLASASRAPNAAHNLSELRKAQNAV